MRPVADRLAPRKAAFSIAISILILVAFLRDIPRSLFETMDIDGAGRLRVLRLLVFPLA
jgi:raffinose/stachyose/melibiose transport system permease protein